MTQHEATDGRREERDRALVEAAPVAMFTLAVEDGSMTSFNPAFERLTGCLRGEWVGRPMTALVYPDDVAHFISQLHQVTLGTTPSACEIRIKTSSGSFRTAELTMTPQLEEGHVRQVMGFTRDVSERRSVVRDLRASKEAAEAASQAKSEFLANVSHEIRTPLNAIVGMTTLLLDMPIEGRAKAFAETVRTSSQTLLGLINSILDFSKIESGKLELENQPFGLRDCVTGAFELVAAAAAEKGLALGVEIAEDCPEAIYGDVTRVRQVLANLLSNAVKFTEQGSVHVAVEARPGAAEGYEVRFTVRDTGPGLTAEEQARIFDAFSQADASTTRRFGGTGLGLSISKRLTELMGGTIGVESAPGEGATFQFSVLARSAHRVAQSTAPVAIDPQLATKHPLRILVAEDHPINQLVAQMLLERLGYKADVVGNGQEALDAVRRQRYDIVFMDVHMPILDGLEATRRIRQRLDDHERLQIVAMTASAMKGDREVCIEAGMDDFVAKPIFIEELQETLEICARRIRLGIGEAWAGERLSAEASGHGPAPEEALASTDVGELPTVDPAALARFDSLDEERVTGFVKTFFETSEQEIERIRTAAEAGEPDQLAEAAHALKGSSGIFGALRLQKICLDLELLGRSDSLADAGPALTDLVKEIEAVRETLGHFS